ncbi:MAG: NAD(P)H-dependent dehydrogenase/reductase [Candidatus Atribacteria bacterium]|nr:NAD(P)H-dependent dehydrogenase/reductase [Candidatus Atribacteria bacterium]
MLSVIKKRRSIRLFQDKRVEQEKIKQLIESALLAPSSKGNNPWQFIVVEDRNIINKLSVSKENGAKFLVGAPLAIAVLADPQQSDVWVEDASIATTFLILTAQSLDLGSCWIQLRKRYCTDDQDSEEYVKKLLAVPDNLRVLCLIAIGYPAEIKPEKTLPEQKLKEVFLNLYGKQCNFD